MNACQTNHFRSDGARFENTRQTRCAQSVLGGTGAAIGSILDVGARTLAVSEEDLWTRWGVSELVRKQIARHAVEWMIAWRNLVQQHEIVAYQTKGKTLTDVAKNRVSTTHFHGGALLADYADESNSVGSKMNAYRAYSLRRGWASGAVRSHQIRDEKYQAW